MGLYKKLMNEDIFDRSDMPQIKANELKKAFEVLKKNGISVKRGKGTVGRWKPSQKDIYKKKVKTIIDRTDDPSTMKPFILSRDNYIVDGHHRWTAMKIKFPNHKFEYYKIDLPIEQAVDVYKKIESLIR